LAGRSLDCEEMKRWRTNRRPRSRHCCYFSIYACLSLLVHVPPHSPVVARASRSIIFRLASRIISSLRRRSVSCLLSFVAVHALDPELCVCGCSALCFPLSSDVIRDWRLYRVIKSGSCFREVPRSDWMVEEAVEGCDCD